MKKYNTPEIEALALETIDVIAASNEVAPTYQSASDKLNDGKYNTVEANFGTWNW